MGTLGLGSAVLVNIPTMPLFGLSKWAVKDERCRIYKMPSRKKLIAMSKSHMMFAGLVVGAVALLTSSSAIAQSNNGDSRDPFARAASGDTTGVLQLMQNLQNGKQRDPNEVAAEQQQQISGNAASFRAEQMRRIRAQQQQQQNKK
jgi:hypothetical protein